MHHDVALWGVAIATYAAESVAADKDKKHRDNAVADLGMAVDFVIHWTQGSVPTKWFTEQKKADAARRRAAKAT